mmetsp:Transcript_62367/g.195506  ORF Transcript_62367/g.195506 Transcript_62367/m.195506 type:complete len:80 (-) Transcript_62367:471-710(-)
MCAKGQLAPNWQVPSPHATQAAFFSGMPPSAAEAPAPKDGIDAPPPGARPVAPIIGGLPMLGRLGVWPAPPGGRSARIV